MQERQQLIAHRSSLIVWKPCRSRPPLHPPEEGKWDQVDWDRSITAEDVKAEVKHRRRRGSTGRWRSAQACTVASSRAIDIQTLGLTVQLQPILITYNKMKESKFYREDKELEADFGNKELVLDLTKKAQKEKFKRMLQKGGKDKAVLYGR